MNRPMLILGCYGLILTACSKETPPALGEAAKPSLMAATVSSDPEASKGKGAPVAPELSSAQSRLRGRWAVVEYDGLVVDPHGVAGSDPANAAAYMAGAHIEFEGERLRLDRGGTSVEKSFRLISARSRDDLTYDMGHGDSQLRFLSDDRIRMEINPITIPHVAVLQRVRAEK